MPDSWNFLVSLWQRHRSLCTLFSFLVLSAVLYGNSVFGSFVFDDSFFTQDPLLRQPISLLRVWFLPLNAATQASPAFRPLAMFSFVLNFVLFGASPLSFHIVNILLNGIACWLLWMLVERLFGNKPLAIITALLFAFLPVHTEAVAYIKSRDEILEAIFLMVGWLSFLRAIEPGARRRWPWISALCVLACAMSKEFGLIASVLYFGEAWLHRRFFHPREAVSLLWPYVAAMALFLCMRAVAVGFMPPSQENLYFGINPLGYLGYSSALWAAFQIAFISTIKPLVPWDLSATYSFHHLSVLPSLGGVWLVAGGAVVLLVLVIALAWRRVRETPIGIGALIFLVLYFPFSKFMLVKNLDVFAEHWLYAPSIGLCLIAATVLLQIVRRWQVVGFAMIAGVLMIYAWLLISRNLVWASEEQLAESMVNDAPDGVHGYVMLAKVRIDQGRIPEAQQLLNSALNITVLHPPVFQLLAVIAMGNRDFAQADQDLQEAERLRPEYADVQLRALLMAQTGHYADSLTYLRSNPFYDDHDFRARMLDAIDLYKLGRIQEAEQYFDWDALLEHPMTREQKIKFLQNF